MNCTKAKYRPINMPQMQDITKTKTKQKTQWENCFPKLIQKHEKKTKMPKVKKFICLLHIGREIQTKS